MFKKGILLISIFAMAVTMVACGGDEPAEPTIPPVQEAPADTAETPTAPVEEAPAEEEIYSIDFTLVNNSGADLVDIRVSASTESDFGTNILPGGAIVPDGNSIELTFDTGAPAGTTFDMFTADDDGDEYEYYGLELTKISMVTLYWEKEADGSFTNVYTVE